MKGVMKKLVIFVVALFVTLIVIASASASSGGVSIVSDGFSPDFAPSTVQPGETTVLTITTEQAEEEGPDATIQVRGLNAAGLTFVSNGDSSASCSVGPHGNVLTCTYTDFAHSYKSDSFTFSTNPAQADGTYSVEDVVNVTEVGRDRATSSLTYLTPSANNSPSPEAPVVIPQESGMQLCYSVGGNTYTTHSSAESMTRLSEGYWAPTATGFNADGTPVLTCEASVSGGFENAQAATEYTDNIGDLISSDEATLGNYPVQLSS